MNKPEIIFIELTVANKLRYVCDIVEKFYQENKKVDIFVQRAEEANQLDNHLWTWKQDTFIPHIQTNQVDEDQPEPIIIFTDDSFIPRADTLVLFDPLPHEKFISYQKIIDFAEVYDPVKIKDSRQRYKQFRDSGQFDLEFTKLGAFLHKQ